MSAHSFPAAPFFAEVADGPANGSAFWLTAEDGVRLRSAVWAGGQKGTVLLFPGRTEYAEKYGRAARDLQDRGYSTLAIDWRGQGLADRPLPDRSVGHVEDFSEYQRDVLVNVALARHLGLPEPYYLLAHSMGGCIGLRALMNGLPVRAAVFSAPMWGISIAAWMRPLAHLIAQVSGWVGQSHRFAPGTSDVSYVAEAEFGGNVLTTDPEMWRYMKRQIVERPELALAGPSIGWLKAALAECHSLSLAPSPDVATITALGTAEKVVDPGPIHLRMGRWRGGRLDLYPGAEHEVIMEGQAIRQRFFDNLAELFDAERPS